MTWALIYSFIKFWLPLITVVLLLIKGYFNATNTFYAWANKVIETNAKLVADRVDRANEALTATIQFHRELVEKQTQLVMESKLLGDSFHEHRLDVLRNHTSLLASVETIKERQTTILTDIDSIKEEVVEVHADLNSKLERFVSIARSSLFKEPENKAKE